MYPECRHVRPSGGTCNSPALKGSHFCYFHARLQQRQSRSATATAARTAASLRSLQPQPAGDATIDYGTYPVARGRNESRPLDSASSRSPAARRYRLHPARPHRCRAGSRRQSHRYQARRPPSLRAAGRLGERPEDMRIPATASAASPTPTTAHPSPRRTTATTSRTTTLKTKMRKKTKDKGRIRSTLTVQSGHTRS